MKYTPQIIYLLLCLIGLLWSAYKHGKPQDNYNFWISLIAQLIGTALVFWGGFFSVFFK